MDVNYNGYQQSPFGYYDANQAANPYLFAYQPQMYQPIQTPQNQNALTADEIQILKSKRPTSTLNLSIEQDDVLRAMCTHKENGHDVVQLVNDGSGDVWCPICNERWTPDAMSEEDVAAITTRFIAQMQNMKWTGDMPTEVIREYCTMIPLLKKFPELYKYASNNFNKYLNQRGYYNANDASIYAQYNSLFAPGYGMPQQPIYQQPQGYYQQPIQAQAPVVNPAVNPMQIQQPVYQQPYNQQFADQANRMMGGTVYQQPYVPQAYPSTAPQAGYVFGAAQPQQPVVAQPAPQAQPQQAEAQQTATTETKIDL